MIESLYFSYFYVYRYVKERGMQYITYLSVYIARGVNAVTEGPCWKILDGDRQPSEGEIEAANMLSTDTHHLGAAIKSDVSEEELA